MILTVCLNPTIQKTVVFSSIIKGGVNRAEHHYTDASGKGVNVSRVLSQLGVDVTHITQLGGMSEPYFAYELQKAHIRMCAAHVSTEIRTCYTLIETAANELSMNMQNASALCVTELVEEGNPVDAAAEENIHRLFSRELSSEKPDAVIISGSKTHGFSDKLYPSLVKESIKAHIPVIADYRGKDLQLTLDAVRAYSSHRQTDGRFLLVIKPNFNEFCATFFQDRRFADVSQQMMHDKIQEISSQYGCAVIVTNGDAPLTAWDGVQFYHKAKYPLPLGMSVKNTIGCGDAFTAGFTASWVSDSPFNAALDEGCRCGALNAASIHPGTILPD